MQEDKTHKDAILELLADRGGAMSPKQISAATGIGGNQVRQLVVRMMHEGLIEKASYGKYRAKQQLGHIQNESEVYPLENGESLPYYEAFLAENPYSVAMFDKEARFILATDAYIKTFEIEEHVPLIGKKISEVFTNEDSLEYERSLLSGNPSTRLEARYYEPNGIPMWLAWRSKPWYYVQSKELGGWLAIVSTGTSRDQVEAVANVAYQDDTKPAFLYNVSPDVGETTHIESVQNDDEGLIRNYVDSSGGRVLPKHLVDAIVSLIDFEVLDMVFNATSEGYDTVEAVRIDVVKKVGDRPYQISLRVNAKPLEGPSNEKGSQPKPRA